MGRPRYATPAGGCVTHTRAAGVHALRKRQEQVPGFNDHGSGISFTLLGM